MQAEPRAQRACLVGGAKRAAPLQFRDEFPGDRGQVVRDHARPQPESGEAGGLVEQPVGEFGRGSGEHRSVRCVLRAVELVQPGLPVGRVFAEEHHQIAEDARDVVLPPDRQRFGADAVGGDPGPFRVVRSGEDDVGRAGGEPERGGIGRQGRHQRLALRRAGSDGRSLDVEPFPGEVDVVQLIAVDEPPGRDIPDLGVVLPAVPQSADHLDVVGGLVEQFRGVDVAATEVRGFAAASRHLRLPARAAGADEVEAGYRLGDVERLGVRDDRTGREADVCGARRDAGGDQSGVETAAHLVGAGGLRAERVLDGDQVEQPALGFPYDVDPVSGGEQFGGTGRFVPPRRGVPAGAVQRHREVQLRS